MNKMQTGFNPTYSEDAPTFEQVSAINGYTIIEFGAPWCEHCLAAKSAVEQGFSEYPDLPHLKFFDGKGKPLGRGFTVKLWPTLILLSDGKEVDRIVRPTHLDEVKALLSQIK